MNRKTSDAWGSGKDSARVKRVRRKEGQTGCIKKTELSAPFSFSSPRQAEEKAHQFPAQGLQLILMQHSANYTRTEV